MASSTASLETITTDIGIRLNMKFTDEQRNFISDFTVPTISFSSPGTGKTAAAIAGLLIAELYHRVPGENIYATSFTNACVGELKFRHARDCKRLDMKQTVTFATLHSICNGIIKDNYRVLGMSQFRSKASGKSPGDNSRNNDFEAAGKLMMDQADMHGFKLSPNQIRPVIQACTKLNAELMFDPAHVKMSYHFRQLHMPYEDFSRLRYALYVYDKMAETVSTDSIMLYTLEIMLRDPSVSKAFKDKCKVLLVDEFQDLSLLELRVVSMLSDCVIAIGDIKQQIYAFQGACPDIVEQYMRYYPNARVANLNKSFRCADEIVEFSKSIIAPNDMGEQDFISVGRHGSVAVRPDLSLGELCDSIERDYRANRNTLMRDILFLFRNNYSAIPIAEELYKRRVPFRVSKFTAATNIPVIRDMLAVVRLAINPSDPRNLDGLKFILAEMSEYKNFMASPIYKIMCKEGSSLFEINYNYRNPQAARVAMDCLFKVQALIQDNRPLREVFNEIWPVFESTWLRKREPYLEMPSRYYMNMVSPLVQTKTYYTFVQDEMAKLQATTDAESRGIGVRCYTFHAAKGLEAEDVYMLDVAAGVCPNTRQLDKKEAMGCALEKARDIRNERSLLFVAATRAKDNLTITYQGEMSPLLQPYNSYQQYDQLYATADQNYTDSEAFEIFAGVKPAPPVLEGYDD